MAGDGEHEVMMPGVHHLDLAAELFPEGLERLHRAFVRALGRSENRPAAVEQFGEAGVGAGPLRARDGMGGMKCTPLGICGPTSATTAPFTEPTSLTIAPGFSAPAMDFVSAPNAPTGVAKITRSAPFTAQDALSV